MLRRSTLLLAISLLASASAIAHSGGLDSLGCHRDRKAHNYHCHKGALAGQQFRSKTDALAQIRLAPPVVAPAALTERSDVQWRTLVRVIDDGENASGHSGSPALAQRTRFYRLQPGQSLIER
jgi:hypothetical protein